MGSEQSKHLQKDTGENMQSFSILFTLIFKTINFQNIPDYITYKSEISR